MTCKCDARRFSVQTFFKLSHQVFGSSFFGFFAGGFYFLVFGFGFDHLFELLPIGVFEFTGLEFTLHSRSISKFILLGEEPLNSFTGMFTRPKLMLPDQIECILN